MSLLSQFFTINNVCSYYNTGNSKTGLTYTLQGILAHQVDEGAACLKCGPEVCAGLDLHFWK